MTTYEEPLPSVEALIVNCNQRTPCVLVLDVSDSMNKRHGEISRIEGLNRGLETLEAELKGDPTAKVRVQIAIVCVGGEGSAARLTTNWTDAKEFKAPRLSAGGTTPLAAGLLLALAAAESQKSAYKSCGISHTRPWMMVITDGEPTDGDAKWQAAVAACRAAEARNKCTIYPIGVEGADMAKLQQLCVEPARKLNQVNFVELFRWLSASLHIASSSQPGENPQVASRASWDSVGSG